uniref:EGF-like domain-containing protein n=1 Tax=Plectus sambesii TaxID=2011161 RepID=A0A914X5M9_9BILA
MRSIILFCLCVWLTEASSVRYTITGASSEIDFSKALADIRSVDFQKSSEIVRKFLQEKLKSTAAAVNVLAFRNSKSEYVEETRGAQFLATIDVDAAQFPSSQNVKSALTSQKNEALRLFKIEQSDQILHDDEPTVFGWSVTPSVGVSSKAVKVSYCQNGGILLPNNTCFCMPYFQGANCEIRLCLNGGFSTKASPRCYCPPGFGGLHCEPLPCLPVTDSTFDFTKKSL